MCSDSVCVCLVSMRYTYVRSGEIPIRWCSKSFNDCIQYVEVFMYYTGRLFHRMLQSFNAKVLFFFITCFVPPPKFNLLYIHNISLLSITFIVPYRPCIFPFAHPTVPRYVIISWGGFLRPGKLRGNTHTCYCTEYVGRLLVLAGLSCLRLRLSRRV